ncbi:MAG TPA: LD-carboxypeptidase [Gemmatimonadaceae bacterium]
MTLTIPTRGAGPAASASTLLRPRALAAGGTIGVALTSTGPKENRVRRGVRVLERSGFHMKLDPEIHVPRRYHRREDIRRAESLMALWSDPAVDAVIAGTGGYGAIRMMQYLDPEVFRHHPKALVGYSDVTALHLWMWRVAGLRTFHGPTLDDLLSPRAPTVAALASALTTPRPDVPLGSGIAAVMCPGHATGRLVGGNLSLVQQSIGTPWEVPVDGAILLLEETKDPMSVADERLLHLRTSGLLSRASGVVFGHLTLDRSEEVEFKEFLLDLVSDLGIPVLMNFPAGHKHPNITLPLGTEMELACEPDTGWLRYHEPALTPHLDS